MRVFQLFPQFFCPFFFAFLLSYFRTFTLEIIGKMEKLCWLVIWWWIRVTGSQKKKLVWMEEKWGKKERKEMVLWCHTFFMVPLLFLRNCIWYGKNWKYPPLTIFKYFNKNRCFILWRHHLYCTFEQPPQSHWFWSNLKSFEKSNIVRQYERKRTNFDKHEHFHNIIALPHHSIS